MRRLTSRRRRSAEVGPLLAEIDADPGVALGAGELFVVPRGVEHCPKSDEETHVLLIEPRGTVNTGDAGGDLTAPERKL